MLTDELISKLLYLQELDVLDFKRKLYDTNNSKELAEFVKDSIALSNSALMDGENSAYLFFGVENNNKNIIGIEGQIINIKKNDKQSPNVNDQNEINIHNQKIFTRIINKYIKGKRGNLRSQYEIRSYQGKLISILSLYPFNGPFEVKEAITQKDQSGNDIRVIYNAGHSWIRIGEETSILTKSEYTDLLDISRSQSKLLKLRKKKLSELGNLLYEWDITKVVFSKGDKNSDLFVQKPLNTINELEHQFHVWEEIIDLTNSDQKELKPWYLNSIIICGQSGTGKSSLINYLAYKRHLVGNLSKPILIQKIPNDPNLENFVQVLNSEVSLNIDASENNQYRRTILIDLDNKTNGLSEFLIKISKKFNDWHIWITCTEDQEEDIKNALLTNKDRDIKILKTKAFNIYDEYIKDFCKNIFGTENTRKVFQNLNTIKFQDIVDVFFAKKIGFVPVDNYKSLDFEEKILLKLIAAFQPVYRNEINFMREALNLEPDISLKLTKQNLILADTTNHLISINPVLDNQKLIFNKNELIFIIELLINKVNLNQNNMGGRLLSYRFATLNKFTNDETLLKKIANISKQLRGDIYCENCKIFFPHSLKYCPGCGEEFNENNELKVIKHKDGLMRLPFPNKKYFLNSDGLIANSIDDKDIDVIIKALSKFSFPV